MSPVELSPASQTASSSSTLWAQPSKEWVIPAKPKPGRKPKKETVGTAVPKDDIDEDSSTNRRVQNRAAQRAFRERKQTQLAELQARLQSYEQGEIERHVALQSVAKKTKEENEELRKENQALRETIARLERERDELLGKKRTHDDSPTSSPTFLAADSSARKRVRVAGDKQNAHAAPVALPAFPSSSPSLSSSPGGTALLGALSPGGKESLSRQTAFPIPLPTDNTISFGTTDEGLDAQDPVHPFNCILCSPDAPCICREVTVHQATDDSHSPLHHISLEIDKPAVSLPQSGHTDALPVSSMSVLDNLPAFQAPVPIRCRTGTSKINSVFPVTPLPTVKCSGDPDNCMACADDKFGKAFCQAIIGHTMNTAQPCFDCPKRMNDTDEILVGGCCGDISKCGSCGIAPMVSSTATRRGPETIPTDDAWRQLKSHPNVAFADLTLLAEVVARRSKCTGSRVVLSPAPGPELGTQHSDHGPSAVSEDRPVVPADPQERFHQQEQRESPPQLVPQHVLIECGRRRVREVNADGVREALRLLDQKFAHMR